MANRYRRIASVNSRVDLSAAKHQAPIRVVQVCQITPASRDARRAESWYAYRR